MGPPIHYYGDMSMANDQDKNNMSKDELEKMVESIIDEVFGKLDLKDEEEETDKEDEEE